MNIISVIILFCKEFQFQAWFLYHICFRYVNLNIRSSSKYRSYHRKVAEWDLTDKLKKYVKHCMERIAKARHIELDNVRAIQRDNKNSEAKMFHVNSMSSEGYHEVYLGDKYAFPTCPCKDWKKFLMPCKHFLAVFEHVLGVSRNSLGEIYTKSSFFSIYYEVFGLNKVTQSSVGSQEDKKVKHEDPVLQNDQLTEVGNKKQFITDKDLKDTPVNEKNCKIVLPCREMLKQIDTMTYIVDHSTSVEELRKNIIEMRDSFAKYTPTDHGLVIENPKAKQKFEKALKRTSYERIPMPRLKKSKGKGKVGVAGEAKRLVTSISIPRQASDAPKILEINVTHFPEKPVKAVASINDFNTQGKNLVIASKIVNQHPAISLSSPLLKNGFRTITYLDLLSKETPHTTSQLANIRK